MNKTAAHITSVAWVQRSVSVSSGHEALGTGPNVGQRLWTVSTAGTSAPMLPVLLEVTSRVRTVLRRIWRLLDLARGSRCSL